MLLRSGIVAVTGRLSDAVLILTLCATCGRKPPAQAGAWALQVSATSGAALVHTDAAGTETFRLACRRNPADLYAALPTFQSAARRDRLVIKVGDAQATLIVSTEDQAAGLAAAGPPQPAILAPLRDGQPIGIVHGPDRLTLQSPPREIADAFATACGKAAS